MLRSPTTRGGISGRFQATTGGPGHHGTPDSDSANKATGAGWPVGAIVWERRNGYTQCVESSA